MSSDAVIRIAQEQARGQLYVSAISSWELAVAALKPKRAGRPDLGDLGAEKWFSEAVAVSGSRVLHITGKIAVMSAEVVATTGHKDPGDCFLIATARARGIPIITRDTVMLDLARDHPQYLSVIAC